MMSTQLSQRSRKLWQTWTHSGRTCTTSLWTRATNSDRPRNNMLLTRLLLMLRYGINTKLWILAHDACGYERQYSDFLYIGSGVSKFQQKYEQYWSELFLPNIVYERLALYIVIEIIEVLGFGLFCSSVNGVWPTTIKLDLDMRVWI